MSNYTCDCCKYETKLKFNYNKHLCTKKHMLLTKNVNNGINVITDDKHVITDDKHVITNDDNVITNDNNVITNDNNVITDITNDIKYYNCPNCDIKFTNRFNLSRHKKKYCKGKQLTFNGTPDNDIIQLEGQIKKLGIKDDVKDSLLNVLNEAHTQNILNSPQALTTSESHNNNSLNNSHNHLNNCGNNNNSNNNVNQSIVVNQFGKEDWSHVTNKNMFDMLKHPRTMIVEAFKMVNLNPDVPQNHNVMVTNKRDDRVKVKEPLGWFSKPKDDTLTTIVDEKYYTLDSFYNDMKNNHPEILKANMRPDEIAAYDKFVLEFDAETNEHNVNNPEMQPMMNQFRGDCFYSLTDFIFNLRLKRKEEKAAAKEAARLARENRKIK